MEEKIFTADFGNLVYVERKDGIAIKRYRGIGEKIIVPEAIEDKEVVAIEKKAFLSCKTIKSIELPDSITEIGDWAFAHAEQLRHITIPPHDITRGKEMFLGCKRLRDIYLSGEEEANKNGVSRMLAAGVTILHDYYLFDVTRIRDKEWVDKWDEKLLKLINLDDLDGFEELWTCGEEDYEGKDYDIKSYPVEKRKAKLRLVYFRLLHPYMISEKIKIELQNYLKSHTKGTEEPESWDIVIEEHPENIEYYKVFTEAGCVNEDNFDDILGDMENVNAQMKAFIMRYKDEKLQKKDAFAAFELDW